MSLSKLVVFDRPLLSATAVVKARMRSLTEAELQDLREQARREGAEDTRRFADSQMVEMRTEGRHMVVEVSGCNPDVLNDLDRVKEILRESALQANAEILELAFHHFTPQGVSGVVVISESHLSIHTWPEYGYAALDVYTCGEKTDPWRAMEYAAEQFGATTIVKTEIARGQEIEGRPGVYGHTIVESEVVSDGVAVVS